MNVVLAFLICFVFALGMGAVTISVFDLHGTQTFVCAVAWQLLTQAAFGPGRS